MKKKFCSEDGIWALKLLTCCSPSTWKPLKIEVFQRSLVRPRSARQGPQQAPSATPAFAAETQMPARISAGVRQAALGGY